MRVLRTRLHFVRRGFCLSRELGAREQRGDGARLSPAAARGLPARNKRENRRFILRSRRRPSLIRRFVVVAHERRGDDDGALSDAGGVGDAAGDHGRDARAAAARFRIRERDADGRHVRRFTSRARVSFRVLRVAARRRRPELRDGVGEEAPGRNSRFGCFGSRRNVTFVFAETRVVPVRPVRRNRRRRPRVPRALAFTRKNRRWHLHDRRVHAVSLAEALEQVPRVAQKPGHVQEDAHALARAAQRQERELRETFKPPRRAPAGQARADAAQRVGDPGGAPEGRHKRACAQRHRAEHAPRGGERREAGQHGGRSRAPGDEHEPAPERGGGADGGGAAVAHVLHGLAHRREGEKRVATRRRGFARRARPVAPRRRASGGRRARVGRFVFLF